MVKRSIAAAVIAVSAVAGVGLTAGTASAEGSGHPGYWYPQETNLTQEKCEQTVVLNYYPNVCAQNLNSAMGYQQGLYTRWVWVA
jgi:hypothetical protein